MPEQNSGRPSIMCRGGNLISVIPTLPDNYVAVIALTFRSMKLLSSGHIDVLRDGNCLSTRSFLNPIRSWKKVNPADGEPKCHISSVGLFSSSLIYEFSATRWRKNPMLLGKGGIPDLSVLRPAVGLRRGLWWTSVAERGFHDRSLSGYVASVKDDLGYRSTIVSSSLRDDISSEGDGEGHDEDGVDISREEDEMKDGEMQSGEDDFRHWGVKPRTKVNILLD